MSGTGESRSELLAWLNDLLQLDFKRVEECGTGAAYCQIMDSIFLDVPMHRVKFDVSQEYDYYPNYKILQSSFARHNIEKIVYVERLVKCRFQDNLEFLQWIKKYWMQHKDSNPYDPLQRRKSMRQVSGGNGNINFNNRDATPNMGNSLNISRRRPMLGQNQSSNNNLNNNTNNSRTSLSNNSSHSNSSTSVRSNYGNRRVSNEQMVTLQNDLTNAREKIASLNNEIDQYKDTTNILEREREFYFGKLRDIEILVQSTQDLINEGLYKNNGTDELTKFLNRVQQILYATEESYTEDENIVNNNNNTIVNDNIIHNDNNYHNEFNDDNTNHTIQNNIPVQHHPLSTNEQNHTLNRESFAVNNNNNNNDPNNKNNNNNLTNTNTNNFIIDEETF
ncbi:protein Bim1p [Monosporozyma unispora]|nr:hypothetical protein C6P44_005396 [Kazachstania unispora]